MNAYVKETFIRSKHSFFKTYAYSPKGDVIADSDKLAIRRVIRRKNNVLSPAKQTKCYNKNRAVKKKKNQGQQRPFTMCTNRFQT